MHLSVRQRGRRKFNVTFNSPSLTQCLPIRVVFSLPQPDDAKVADIPVDKKGHVDFSKDFFGRRCCLTVSGQLNVETHACALSDVVSCCLAVSHRK